MNPYNYGGYPIMPQNNYYAPPMPDQLAQLRGNQYNQNMMQQNMNLQPTQMSGANMQTMNTLPSNNMLGSGILWVSSEKEANDYPLAINSAVALWDSNNPVIYLKQSDASGKPSMKIYDLIERDTSTRNEPQGEKNLNIDFITRGEFNALSVKFDALMTQYQDLSNKYNDLSNSSKDEKSKKIKNRGNEEDA